jgi:tetratricopeptide (TPR) repeat protein
MKLPAGTCANIAGPGWSIADDAKSALPLLRAAIRYHEDAVRVPAPDGDDLAGLAFLHQQMSDVLDETGDKPEARAQLEASVTTWRQAVKSNQINYKYEIRLADTLIALGDVIDTNDATKSRDIFIEAANLMRSLLSRVPRQGRSLVLEPLHRALSRAGDIALKLNQTDEAIMLHQQALTAASELVTLKPDSTETHIDLGRQHGRLARALEKAKRYADAREHAAEARRLFVEHREVSGDPVSVGRLVTWVDQMVETIQEGETGDRNEAK